jgi:hypothetical protein
MRRLGHGFSLIEVVFAVGVIAVSVVTVVTLFGSTSRSVAEMSEANGARRLVDQLRVELERARDALPPDASTTRLDGLAMMIEADGLRLVSDRAGRRVRAESAANGSDGVPVRERFYLIEVQPHRGAIAYRNGSGFLALSIRIRWPYIVPTGPADEDVAVTPVEDTHEAFFNLALTP